MASSHRGPAAGRSVGRPCRPLDQRFETVLLVALVTHMSAVKSHADGIYADWDGAGGDARAAARP
jgi:hypothetical protein